MADTAYRADIDGLRAIAVVSVVLFHGEIALPGGFLGVDVFFVISGYLICRLLLSEFDRTGHVSIARFYERRIRRIFPAMFVVCALCVPFALTWMFEGELKSFFDSALAALFFVANIFFYQETGYFAAAAEQKPFIHFWSLAVEEQYYLVFPLFLAFAHRWTGRRCFLWMSVIALVLSAALMAWGSTHMRSAAFYLTPFRVWELLAGVLVATISPVYLTGIARPVREAGALIASALILGAMVLYDPLSVETAFPYMLTVVAGSALLIAVGHGTWVGRGLAWRPVVGVGLISYSTYLYHQPLFTFARLRLPEGLTLELAWVLAILSFGLGWLSWRFVEQPFRDRAHLTRTGVFRLAGLATLILTAVVLTLRLSPLPTRFPPQVVALSDTLAAGTYGLSPTCQTDWDTSADCTTGDTPRTLLWGDSYAMHLAYGLEATQVAFRQAALPSCFPRMRPKSGPKGRYEVECAAFNAAVTAWVKQEVAAGRLETVIITSRDLGVRAGAIRRMPREARVDRDAVLTDLDATIAELRASGLRVGLVGPPPPADFDPGQCLLRVAAFGGAPDRCEFALHPEAGVEDRRLADLARTLDLPFLSLAQQICPDGQCAPFQNDTVLYRDNGHLTPQGSALLFDSPAGKEFMKDLGLADRR
ncbi:MAG TPA: acyltransferase family protein [Arenimonas sp.]|uniref:acyltransferase family protein n=1 Tax=Arenimonas sp. TaxID=1872635 RepID=UPI002D7EA3F6|nr:acyltransferase family protein [Arenimonas sp.]HEU0152059.1 acyltransferase family protein [Arenimonas sp.]